jgi:hypothetical protein
MKLQKLFIGLILLTLCSACAGIRSGGNRYVDTFYKGKGNILFHVNAFRLKGKKGNPDVIMDMTYNYAKDSTREVTILFSVLDRQFVTGPYFASLQNVTLDSVHLMFAEIRGRKYLTRFSSSMPYDTFYSVFQNPAINFKLKHAKGNIDIPNARKWKQVAHHIRIDVLDVIKLTEAQ